MNEYPSVSVVVPTRDRPELLRAALGAILDQDYPGAIEVIVVYDHSRAGSVARNGAQPKRRVRVISNSRTPGLAGARNTGILAATGELVAFCDDDDEWLPGKLAPRWRRSTPHRRPSSSLRHPGQLRRAGHRPRPRARRRTVRRCCATG